MKLLVTGGNGFIGRAVCAMAVGRGMMVTSLARRGRPLEGSSPGLDKVTWLTGSVFDVAALDNALQGSDAVVHCIGISREHPTRKETFKSVNGDSAIAVGEAAKRAGISTFVFLSAGEKPPWAHEEYLSSKRRAEVALAKMCQRLVVLRPGLVYGSDRILASLAARVLKFARTMRPATALIEATTPIRVETLARAVIRAILDPNARGVIEAPRIASFAETAVVLGGLGGL